MDFARTPRRKIRALNLTPLIDVLFILIIFFMLTTSFMKIESMELILPSAAQKTAAKQGDEIVRLYLSASGDIALGQRKLGAEEIDETLSRIIVNNPDTRIMLLTADGVTMQQLVSMMDRVSLLGGKSLLVRKWAGKRVE
ncbi:MAG: biopolymer transporter ExbD [Rickettsiales bacterium]|jgi:biopolymer transport protein ExbD|nr:biopolymer transporter ExbD [Rickettsiales bacterium]